MPAAVEGALDALRVLYLEDNAVIAMNFVAMLEEQGAIVDDHSTVVAALKALRDGDYDVALLDVDIRGATSFSVAEAALSKDVALVFVTGYGHETLPAPWREYPLCEKPCSGSELSAAIQHAIASKDRAR
jgi:CheY-like chemotaxis protein